MVSMDWQRIIRWCTNLKVSPVWQNSRQRLKHYKMRLSYWKTSTIWNWVRPKRFHVGRSSARVMVNCRQVIMAAVLKRTIDHRYRHRARATKHIRMVIIRRNRRPITFAIRHSTPTISCIQGPRARCMRAMWMLVYRATARTYRQALKRSHHMNHWCTVPCRRHRSYSPHRITHEVTHRVNMRCRSLAPKSRRWILQKHKVYNTENHTVIQRTRFSRIHRAAAAAVASVRVPNMITAYETITIRQPITTIQAKWVTLDRMQHDSQQRAARRF